MIPALPFAELKNHKSIQKPSDTILTCVLGTVYDVTDYAEQFYGPGKPYAAFAGHDITYALAKMSLKPEACDTFEFTLKKDDLKTLAEWIGYFDELYPKKYYLVDLPCKTGRYPLKYDDLPPLVKAKKFGGVTYGGGDIAQQNEANRKRQLEYEKVVKLWESKNDVTSLDSLSSNNKDMVEDSATKKLTDVLMSNTKILHVKVMRTTLMSLCVQGNPRVRKPYKMFIASLYFIYQELEPRLDQPFFSKLHDPEKLNRIQNLKEDLEYFFGPRYVELMPGPRLSTIRYVTRIHDVSAKPHLLLVHHWIRYGAGLAGGQFLRISLEKAFNLNLVQDANSPLIVPTPGIRYHQFEKIPHLPTFYDSYLSNLNEIGEKLSSKEIDEMVEEAKIAFKLNIDLNEEIIEVYGSGSKL